MAALYAATYPERMRALVLFTRSHTDLRDRASPGGPASRSYANGLRDLGLEGRGGIHTGECELHDGKVAGLAVSIGARVAASAGPSEVLVSQTVKDLVAGTGLLLEDRGERELKGVPGSWRVYMCLPAEPVVEPHKPNY